jgi:hypothetical protein
LIDREIERAMRIKLGNSLKKIELSYGKEHPALSTEMMHTHESMPSMLICHA